MGRREVTRKEYEIKTLVGESLNDHVDSGFHASAFHCTLRRTKQGNSLPARGGAEQYPTDHSQMNNPLHYYPKLSARAGKLKTAPGSTSSQDEAFGIPQALELCLSALRLFKDKDFLRINLETAQVQSPLDPWGNGSRTPKDTEICGCSSPLAGPPSTSADGVVVLGLKMPVDTGI